MKKWQDWSLATAVPLALVAWWWFGSANSTSIYFPPLAGIAEAFNELWLFERWPSDVLPSLQRMGIGYALSVVVGILLGVLIGYSRFARQTLAPYIDFLRSIPPAAVLPLAIVLFGIGDGMKIFVVVFGAIWPILLNTADGVRSVDQTLLNTMRAFNVPTSRTISRVIIPAALPQVFAGLRTSLSLAIILIVVSELTTSTNGLGYFILNAQRTFAITDMWSGILLLGFIGVGFNIVFVAVERIALRWYFQSQRVEG